MPPLDGALARSEVQRQAIVSQHLHLDVAGRREVALEVHRVPAERRARPVGAGAQRLDELRLVVRHLHADAAAAPGGLHQQREPERARLVEGGVGRHVSLGSRGDRHARVAHHRARLRLVLDRAHRAGRWTDEDDSGRGARLGEARLLGKKAVPGMDRLGARAFRGGEDLHRVQIALARGSRAQAHCLVALLDVQGALVGVGVHGDGAGSERARRAGHAAGDLTAVGDEQLVEHVELASGGTGPEHSAA